MSCDRDPLRKVEPRRATTLVETLVVLTVIVVVGSLIGGIGSAVWKLLKSWQ